MGAGAGDSEGLVPALTLPYGGSSEGRVDFFLELRTTR